MAATWTKKVATPNRLRYLVVGDGTVVNTRTSAQLLADMVDGPLKTLWNAEYANQAAMQAALLDGQARITVTPRKNVAIVAGELPPDANVDADAVTATKAEVNVNLADTGSPEVYIELEFVPTPTY